MKKLKENSSFKTLTYRQKEEDFQKTSTSEAVSVLQRKNLSFLSVSTLNYTIFHPPAISNFQKMA